MNYEKKIAILWVLYALLVAIGWWAIGPAWGIGSAFSMVLIYVMSET